MLDTLEAIPDHNYGDPHSTTSRGHRRIEHRIVQTAPVPAGVDFPHAAQIVRVYRERADLDDRMTSQETSYYLTSITGNAANTELLGRHVRGHWRTENRVHWVRDWAFDEDRHQHRAPRSPARTLASLPNLAISHLRLTGANDITATLRWVARNPTRSAALIGA